MISSFEKYNVLIAHSNAQMCASITEMLHAFGFKWVLSASDIKTTLEMLTLNRIDLLITHYDEDKLDGHNLVKKIRAGEDKLDPNLRIVLVSLEGDNALMEKAVKCGANVAIAIPVVTKDFYSMICTLFRNEGPKLISSRYAGPDRRHVDNRPTHRKERRGNENMEPSTAQAERAGKYAHPLDMTSVTKGK